MELRYPWAFPKCLIPWIAPEPFAPRGSSEMSLECQGRDVRGNLGEPEVLGGLPAEQSQQKPGAWGYPSLRLLEFGIVLMWVCPSVRSGSPQIWENSTVDLHLFQG